MLSSEFRIMFFFPSLGKLTLWFLVKWNSLKRSFLHSVTVSPLCCGSHDTMNAMSLCLFWFPMCLALALSWHWFVAWFVFTCSVFDYFTLSLLCLFIISKSCWVFSYFKSVSCFPSLCFICSGLDPSSSSLILFLWSILVWHYMDFIMILTFKIKHIPGTCILSLTARYTFIHLC